VTNSMTSYLTRNTQPNPIDKGTQVNINKTVTSEQVTAHREEEARIQRILRTTEESLREGRTVTVNVGPVPKYASS
jgi:hypothetical protein